VHASTGYIPTLHEDDCRDPEIKDKDAVTDILTAFRFFNSDGAPKISVRLVPETRCSFPNIKQCYIRLSCTKIR
jgi:hypothetical protein